MADEACLCGIDTLRVKKEESAEAADNMAIASLGGVR